MQTQVETESAFFFIFFRAMPSPHIKNTATDEELLASYKDGHDLKVLGILYHRYMSLVYGVSMKYLKDREESRDAVMQIFEKLVESLKTHDVQHFKSWLYVTARNYCLMQLRSSKKYRFKEIDEHFMESEVIVHLDDEPEIELNISKLEKCIEGLGAEQKRCVQLFYLNQKCYRDITEITGYDDNKVKSYIQNGKRNLKICMEQNG
jgi:RNA polymerase sigma factor (sigma-70 family)